MDVIVPRVTCVTTPVFTFLVDSCLAGIAKLLPPAAISIVEAIVVKIVFRTFISIPLSKIEISLHEN